MGYLIYNTEEEAKERSALAGEAKGLSFHVHGMGTKYWWTWLNEPTEDNPRSALVVPMQSDTDQEGNVIGSSAIEKDLLTEEELTSLVEALPEDWAELPEMD